MRSAEIVSGLLATFLGVAIIIAAGNFPNLPTVDVGPAFFPRVIGIILIIFGLLLSIVSFFIKGEKAPLKEIFNRNSLFALGTIVIYGIYIFLVSLLGFIIATPIMIIGLAFFLKGKQKIAIFVSAILVTIAIHYLFLKLLLIPLPRGIFF